MGACFKDLNVIQFSGLCVFRACAFLTAADLRFYAWASHAFLTSYGGGIRTFCIASIKHHALKYSAVFEATRITQLFMFTEYLCQP